MKIILPDECELCPRKCHANRRNGETGRCGANDKLKAGLAYLHMWEEPCLSGEEGSGTVFFSGCSLGCIYCQNSEISRNGAGSELSADRLCEIFFELEAEGANNINLVTAAQYLPFVKYAVKKAKQNGIAIPFVYNTGGYESVAALSELEGLIDIYLPDFKYTSSKLAKEYSDAENYPQVAKAALAEMVRQTGQAEFDKRGMMTRGVIVRLLLLPGQLADMKKTLDMLYAEYDNRIYISLMRQYTPVGKLPPPLDRKVTAEEYNALVEYAISLGVENGFVQEGDAAEESFIPLFDGRGIIKK